MELEFLKILVVESEAERRKLLLNMLNSSLASGQVVEAASSLEEAVKMLKSGSFQAVLLNLNLPDSSGLITLVKVNKKYPDLAIVAVTEKYDEELGSKAIISGAQEYLVSNKCDAESLRLLVHYALKRKHSEISLSRVNKCLLSFGPDHIENIRKIIDSSAEVFAGACVLYQREGPEDVEVSAGANLPDGLLLKTPKEGSLSSDVVAMNSSLPLVINVLDKTPYASSDPNISKYGFKTFMGCVIRSKKVPVGALCVFYREDKIFAPNEMNIISILSLALGVEEERREAFEALKKAYGDLKDAQLQLVQSEKLAALGRFAAGVAHEVKNPLGIILGGTEFLERKLVKSDSDTKMALGKIKESTLRADGIVHSLLKFARPSELKMEKVKPEEIVTEALGFFQYRGQSQHIKVETDFPKEISGCVEVDKNQMQQVLLNLLVNASDAMPKGGRIKVSVSDVPEPGMSLEKGFYEIKVSDSGEGIPKENLAKIFEPFFTTKRDKKGTGLGLSIVKSIIENHRGSIAVESEAGKGTDIKILLPKAE